MSEAATAEVVHYQDETDPEIGLDWRVRDVADADWALRRLGELRREIDQNNAVGKRDIERILLRVERLNERAARGAKFFESHLAAFAKANRESLLGSGKKKSRKLPHGSIGWRKCGGQMKVEDPAALLDWARAQPIELGLLRIKEEPAVGEIKLHVKKTGEVPPGTVIEPEDEEFQIKTDEEMSNGNEH